MRCLRIASLLLVAASLAPAQGAAAGWQAGVARVKITPQTLMWMSGYAARTQPAQGTRHELWAKALAIRDAEGRTAVLVTMDLVGIDRGLSQEVCRRIEQQYDVPRAGIALATSHTHTGPVVRTNLLVMYDLDPRQRTLIDQYAEKLADDLVAVAGAAVEDLQPAKLSWGIGAATFAVNRRNNPENEAPQRRASGTLVGPVDHDVPVLAVHSPEGQLRAVVGGYACHATTLGDYLWGGDWPGAAQLELERRHPDAIALYWAGCGGDQNPLPRRTPDLMEQHGRAFADAVDAALDGHMHSLDPSLNTTYQEISLPFDDRPTRSDLQAITKGEPRQARWARDLLEKWPPDGELPSSYPYPVQAWRLGDELAWVFLGGEVVVDYALRIKQELDPERTWIAAYANDVMGYIPSRRVLGEGGYEGGESRYIYGLPAVWDESVEQTIIDAVRKIAGKPE